MAERADSNAGDARAAAGRRLVKNTAVLVALRVLIPLLSVALMLVLSRRLGAEGVGRYTLVYGYLALFNTVAPLGLYAVITRDGAREPERLGVLLSNAFVLGTLCSLALSAVMAGVGVVAGYDAETGAALLLLSLALLPYTLGNFLEGASVALERTEHIAVATLAEYLLKVGGGVAALLYGYGLDAVLVLAVVGKLLGCVINALLLRRHGVRVGWRPQRAMLARLLRLAPTFLAIAVFATLYWRTDIVMLSWWQPIEVVGYYGASWRLLEFAMVVPTSLCLALYPQIALLIDQDRERLRALARVVLGYLLALTLPVAVAVTLLAEPLLALLFGDELRPAAPVLQLLIWTLLPYCLVRYHAYVLVGAERQRVDLYLNVLMALFNVALNALLIPRHGALGAAAATCASIVLYALLQYAYLLRRLPDLAGRFRPAPSALLATALTALAIYALSGRPYLAMLLSPPLYLALLLGGGFVTRSQLDALGFGPALARWRLDRLLRA